MDNLRQSQDIVRPQADETLPPFAAARIYGFTFVSRRVFAECRELIRRLETRNEPTLRAIFRETHTAATLARALGLVEVAERCEKALRRYHDMIFDPNVPWNREAALEELQAAEDQVNKVIANDIGPCPKTALSVVRVMQEADASFLDETLLEATESAVRLAKDLGRPTPIIDSSQVAGLFSAAILPDTRTIFAELFENSILHGIEPPELRQEAGKPLFGKIAITGKTERKWITLSYCDDGAGIQPSVLQHPERCNGIVTIRETVEKLGGSIHFEVANWENAQGLRSFRVWLTIPAAGI